MDVSGQHHALAISTPRNEAWYSLTRSQSGCFGAEKICCPCQDLNLSNHYTNYAVLPLCIYNQEMLDHVLFHYPPYKKTIQFSKVSRVIISETQFSFCIFQV